MAARCRAAPATDSRSIRRGPRLRGCPRDPGLVLLQVGFAMPPSSPRERCALTAPFHPCLRPKPAAVYFLLHCPSSHLDWPLASTLPCGARTFLDESLSASPRSPTPTSAEARAVYPASPRTPGENLRPVRLSPSAISRGMKWPLSLTLPAPRGEGQEGVGLSPWLTHAPRPRPPFG